jgi:hypothetical protein
MYENIMKPANIMLYGGEGGGYKVIKGINEIKIHYLHVWTSQNEALCKTNIC